MLRYLLPIITIITGFASRFSFDRVPQGSLGIKLKFGKVVTKSQRRPDGRYETVPLIMYPGFRFMLPGVHQIRHTHVLTCTLPTPRFPVRLQNGKSYEVEAAATFSIQPVTGVLFALAEVENFTEWMVANFQARLTHLLTQLPSADDLISAHAQWMTDIQAQLGAERVKVQKVLVTVFAPTNMTQLGEILGSRSADLLEVAQQTLRLVPTQADGSLSS